MNETDQHSIQQANDWLNQSGQPSYAILKSLTEQNTPEAMEALRQLADRYNVTYTLGTSPKEFLDMITLAMKENDGN